MAEDSCNRLSAFIRASFLFRALGKRRSRWWLIILILVLSLTFYVVWRIYSDSENQLSDLNRLYLLRCYFGALFSGSNRFIYGMGFTNASNYQCQDAGIIEDLSSHAHNIFAQLAADNGFFRNADGSHHSDFTGANRNQQAFQNSE